MSVNVGDKAPDFTLKRHNLENITLSKFRGDKNVVLLFFPLANTGGCTKELCYTRDNISQYENLDAEVLAISVDSPFVQKLWAEQQGFNFSLLSDFNKEVSPLYGAFYDVFLPGKLDMKGVAKRSAFVIDKQGVIRYAEVLEDPGEMPNFEAITQILANLK